MRKALLALVPALTTAVAVLSFSPAAEAQARRHDGFYLRLGGGFGFLAGSAEVEGPNDVFNAEGSPAGFGVAGELALGGSISPGVVLGGGIYSHYFFGPEAEDAEVTAAGITGEGDAEWDSLAFTLIGPMIDYYPNPRSGLHLQGSIGYAMLGSGDVEFEGGAADNEHSAGGVGLMVGLGHEWWISSSWGVGILGRVTAGFASGEDDDDNEWSYSLITPALLFTATMN